MTSDGTDGKLFRTVAPATVNVRRAVVGRRVCGTIKLAVSAKRRPRRTAIQTAGTPAISDKYRLRTTAQDRVPVTIDEQVSQS